MGIRRRFGCWPWSGPDTFSDAPWRTRSRDPHGARPAALWPGRARVCDPECQSSGPSQALDLTLDAFARFAAGKPANVRLCLHQAIAHEVFVAPLREQATRLGIIDRILWFPREPGPLSDAGLNELYNACAVGLNTTMGEGFGLVSFEHAATGAPQVVPAHPALCELWEDGAELVRPVRPTHTEYSPLLMGEVDAISVAESLNRLYSDREHYSQMAQAGLARTGLPEFNWSVPANHLVNALCQTIRL